MNKVNRLMILTMILFIVLIPLKVLASSEEAVSLISQGTINNPFLINIEAAGGSQTFQFDNYPFYFKVNTPGAYEINLDNAKKEVSFRLTDNNVNKIVVLIDEDNSDKFSSKQLGANYKTSQKSFISPAIYDISELLVRISNSTSLPMRKTKLYNVAPNASIMASRGNLYYFTTFEDTKIKEQVDIIQNSYQVIDGEVADYGSIKIDDMIYEFNGVNNTALSSSPADSNSIEAIVTRLFLAIGDNFLLKSLRALFKSNNISINTLIFNQFEPTKLDLYNQEATGINKTLRDAVNTWYNVFLTFTYIAYIIILVYIGIMMISTSGTPRQERAKSFITNWVVGLVILLLLPHYGFPLIFKLNDALVTYVGRDAVAMDTYYTVLERYNEIDGGDSMTVAIQKLEKERADAQKSLEVAQQGASTIVENTVNELLNPYFSGTAGGGMYSYYYYLTSRLKSAYYNYKGYRENEDISEAKTKVNQSLSKDISYSTASYDGVTEDFAEGIRYRLINDGGLNELLDKYEEAYQYETQIEQIDQDIVTLQNDILGLMRSYAGEYNRLVFGVLFLMLLFQLIGLLILYIKRMIMIAILIAVFPLIMLFYCIDKMADNTAQTLSLWFKEFLSNVFIQSIHAVIYVVLVEMGLEVFKRDNGNWLLLVIAMMLILPAESIMKALFNLNGSSLGQIGGMFEKATIGIGAIRSLATAGKRSTDKAVTSREKQFAKNMQRSQTIADNKKAATDLKRQANSYRKDGAIKDFNNKIYDRRDKAYESGNKARQRKQALHNVATTAGRYTRVARNAGSIAVGAAYGLAGGDVTSLAQGAAIARTLSGKQGTDTEYVKEQKKKKEQEKLKQRVGNAYNRKKS